MSDIPILDNHAHLDKRHGEGIEAVEKFARSGGTHLCVVNKPFWSFDIQPSSGRDWEDVFEGTLNITDEARSVVEGDVFPVLGVHPVGIDRLLERFDIDEVEKLMKGGLDLAAKYVEENKAIALKSGRPHYEVSDEVLDVSNSVMKHSFKLAKDLDCAVQLHTESSDRLKDIVEMADEVGLSKGKIVKHYSPPSLEDVVPSVLAKEQQILEAIDKQDRFLIETDYIDDLERPGAVLGLRNVPRKTLSLLENEKYREPLYKAHVDTPNEVYGIDISL